MRKGIEVSKRIQWAGNRVSTSFIFHQMLRELADEEVVEVLPEE
jgi:hypothetical protein